MESGNSPVVGSGSMPDGLYITEELGRRPTRVIDHQREMAALQDLVSRLAGEPDAVLPRFVQLAMELTGASSAGVSLLEPNPSPGVFRWHELQGKLAAFTDTTTPRNHSPCGTTLDHNRPMLCSYPERHYEWLAEAGVPLDEVLLVPLYIGSEEPAGTLWVVADEPGHFCQADADALAVMAEFVSNALQVIDREQSLRGKLDEQELLTREMSHRLKNLFSVSDPIINLSARTAETPDDLAESLSGRLRSLAAAHSYVVPRAGKARGSLATDLETLIRSVTAVHDSDGEDVSRFVLQGPQVSCGDHSVSGLALLVHELTTNAAKYGALKKAGGLVHIDWKLADGMLLMTWRETGGPRIEQAPGTAGFGTTLARRTVAAHFAGTFDQEWAAEGLICRIGLAADKLAS